ncbi:MAG: hypothetical protein A2145_01040 [candidate division Zixibacteria bacterium RBG_16_40_9]|nr:MAG: hypothetical protein A2145_01040 [candidate division Zixibacteria bacterium RBG_16_40_9]
MKKSQLQKTASDCRQSLADIFEAEVLYSDGAELIIQGRPKVEDNFFKDMAYQRISNLGYNLKVEETEGYITLKISPPGVVAPKKIPWINILLFILTIFSTLLTGAMSAGQTDFLNHPQRIFQGASYSFWLLSILLFHEFGHYWAAKNRKVKVTLPYFIPGPTLFGTFGAFIRAKSPFKNRRELLEVGAAGPVAGFVVSVLAIIFGLSTSQIVKTIPETEGLHLGDSLLFSFLSKLVIGDLPIGHDILLSPVAFAGWAGLLVTMLNLIPIGQLDGGHISYALFGNRQKIIGNLATLGMIGLAYFWPGWLVWVALAILMRTDHPPTLNDQIPLHQSHKILGWISYAIFILCFIPVPLQ